MGVHERSWIPSEHFDELCGSVELRMRLKCSTSTRYVRMKRPRRSAAGQPKGGQAGAKRLFNFDRGRERSIKAGVSAVINPDCAAKCNPLTRGYDHGDWKQVCNAWFFAYCNRRRCAESVLNRSLYPAPMPRRCKLMKTRGRATLANQMLISRISSYLVYSLSNVYSNL